MSSGKLTPRQKMINMMYLVLTALLALNVSREILNAFAVVNEGLLQQRESMNANNYNIYAEFENQAKIDTSNQKIKMLNQRAKEVAIASGEMSEFIMQLKRELIMEVEGVDENRASELEMHPFLVNRKDDYDSPTRYFGTDNPPGQSGKAAALRAELNEFKDRLLKIVENTADSSKQKSDLEKMLSRLQIINTNDPASDDPEGSTWEMKYFYHLPLSAALTELTKWENIVKSAENEMLSYLWEQNSANLFKFDAVEAKIIPKSTYILSGTEFEAEVFLAGVSTSTTPKIIIGSSVDMNSGAVTGGQELSASSIFNGKGLIKMLATGTGEREVAGSIMILDPKTNTEKSYPFSMAYKVAPPAASVAATKMNLLYLGLENPVSIAVPGASLQDVTISCSNATYTGSNGSYIIKPSSKADATVSVFAKMPDGTSQLMGTQLFRVKSVPDPVLQWNGVESGGSIAAGNGDEPVIPIMKSFEFDVYSRITSLSISFDNDGMKSFDLMPGNVPNTKCAAAISKLRKGTKIYVEAKTEKPGGDRVTLYGVFYIK